MNETLLHVLLYLFEHYIYDDPDAVRVRDSLQASLIQAGFSPSETSKAFDWLDELARQRPEAGMDASIPGAVRVFVDSECTRLDPDSRGFLMYLERNGILDAAQRELVIDRAMALEQAEMDVDDIKWVVLMVLFNQPGSEAAFAWLESQMFDHDGEALH